MIGTSRSELIFIRICIFLIHYSIPCSVALLLALYLLAGAVPFTQSLPLYLSITSSILATILIADTVFALAVYIPFKSWATAIKSDYPTPGLSASDRATLFRQCLDNIPNPEDYLRRWFLGADLADIRRENVREFLAWAFFDRESPDALSEAEKVELDGYLDDINQLLLLAKDGDSRGLRPGCGTAQSLRTNIDEVPMCFRSVVWYAIVMIVDVFTHTCLLWRGFTYYGTPMSHTLAVFPPRPQLLVPSAVVPRRLSPASSMAYWYRPHTSRTSRPILFIHGIGIGHIPYLKFLSEISEGLHGDAPDPAGQVGVIALEILPVSMRLAGAPLDQASFLSEVSAILGHHGWLDDDFVLISHSYGSVLTTHVLRCPTLGPRVAATVLIDPVSLLLHLPDVAYNFTRRAPRAANEWQLWFFASMDPGTALALGRYFFWQRKAIWKEELLEKGPGRRRKVAVALAGWDTITDTRRVLEYLLRDDGIAQPAPPAVWDAFRGMLEERIEGGNGCVAESGVELIYFPTLDHAQVFDRVAERRRIVRVVRGFCCSDK